MEFVRGGDLMYLMQRKRQLPEIHARFYVAEISLALNYLHTKGIINCFFINIIMYYCIIEVHCYPLYSHNIVNILIHFNFVIKQL